MSELGQRVAAILEAGELVPDEVVTALVRERLAQADAKLGFILDGFPRTGAQADALDGLLRDAGRVPVRVVCLDVPEPELIRRILSRGEGRADDNEEAVRTRLELYRRETAPLLDHYGDAVVRLDATGSMDDIADRVGQALEL